MDLCRMMNYEMSYCVVVFMIMIMILPSGTVTRVNNVLLVLRVAFAPILSRKVSNTT